MSASDHYTDTHGAYINIVPTQDALGPHCDSCGRSVFPRKGGTEPERWQHTTDCPEYLPHPLSIAGQPGYTPSA